jgi:hypothetical protein
MDAARGVAPFDSALGVVVMFGGTDGKRIWNDVWHWDGTRWSRRKDAPADLGGRTGHVMAFDPEQAVTIVFGGTTPQAAAPPEAVPAAPGLSPQGKTTPGWTRIPVRCGQRPALHAALLRCWDALDATSGVLCRATALRRDEQVCDPVAMACGGALANGSAEASACWQLSACCVDLAGTLRSACVRLVQEGEACGGFLSGGFCTAAK